MLGKTKQSTVTKMKIAFNGIASRLEVAAKRISKLGDISIETAETKFDLKFKCVGDGLLEIAFRGPDIRNELNKYIPYCVDLNVIKINNEDIINNPLTVWHNNSHYFKKNVYGGEIIKLHVEWSHFKEKLFEGL